ncbi:MAG TPA: anti-sigma factor [Acetobacteraceae bacterium]|nr:anti-sigma factor [Acetobacteraceae bacterium]
MQCDRARPLLPQLIDRALGPLRRLFVTRHLAHCAACSAQLEELQSMQAAIRSNLPYHRAPPGLAARIGAMLPREDVPAPSRSWLRMPAFTIGGTGLAGALAGVALTLLVVGGGRSSDDAVVQSVIGDHVRSLMADHLTDVLTSDQHTVKPWLSARLDVSPAVRDLKDEGFPLVGGRLDYVDGHPAAAVVYRHAKHVINLFAWASPGKPDTGFHDESRQGFNIVTWRHGGITYYAVSDVEADQLSEFAKLVEAG